MIKRLLSSILSLCLFTCILLTCGSGLVLAAGNIDPADWTLGANVSVTDGYLTNSATWQASVYAGTYENFTLNTKLDNTARIFFASTNAWTDRMYVEADFGGALILRDNADTTLADAAVALTADTLITITVAGDNVKVYADDVLKIDKSGTAAKAGSVGIIFTAATAKVSDFDATETAAATGNIDPADWTLGDSVSVTDGYLTNSATWQAAVYAGTYENFTLNTKLDNTARIFFASTNAWTDRMYVEADFGGALILRDNADTTLAAADVALTADTLITIVVEGDNVKVYADDVLKIDKSGTAAKAGSVGIIFTAATAKVSDFDATENDGGSGDLTLDGTLVYEDDFSDPLNFAADWDLNEGMESSFAVSDGALNAATGFKGATLPITLESFEWDVYLDASARLVFYSDPENPYGLWLGDRYYLEVDFGGALILRDGYDVTLKSVPVPLTSGEFNRVTIKVANGVIQVFMAGDSTPVLQYTDLSLTSGNFAVISTVSDLSFDYMALYELPVDYELELIDEEDTNEEDPVDLVDAQPVDTSVKDGVRKGYFFDFSDEDHFGDYWFGVTETYLEDGMLKSTGQISGGIIDAKKMENTEIDTVVNNNTRITFRISGSNIWTDNRYYVELDYGDGGALLLRQNDEIDTLADVNLGDLVVGQNVRVVVRTVGTKVEVFLNGSSTPSLSYDGLEDREGYVGYQIIYKKTAMSYFSVAELTDDGEYVELDPSSDDISDDGSSDVPDDNPQSGDGVVNTLIVLLSSALILTLTVLINKKRTSAKNKAV